MYRENPYRGPKLPQSIIDKVAGTANPGGRKNGHRKTALTSRREKRKTERQNRKRGRSDRISRREEAHKISQSEDDSDESMDENNVQPRIVPTKNEAPRSKAIKRNSFKASKASEASEDSENDIGDENILPDSLTVPKQTKESLRADDAEIAALERKLGIKTKSLPKSFIDDGLGGIFGDFPDESSDEQNSQKRKRKEADEWLKGKRQKYQTSEEVRDGASFESGSVLEDFSDRSSADDDISAEDDRDENMQDEDFDGFATSDDENSNRNLPTRVKENPYVAPGTSQSQNSNKYVPPSLRVPSSEDAELNKRLQKQIQGLLNRLSDSNLISIVGEIEKLYRTNPRQYVTSIVVDLLLALLGDRTVLNDTLINLHAGFIAALYKLIGPDFGAQMVEALVSKIDSAYTAFANEADGSKEFVNLISLLTQLFNCSVVTGDLIFDYLKTFLATLSEPHTEVILRIVRLSGPRLRQDDPSSLKDLVQLLQQNAAAAPSGSLSVRTRFMIDTISDLKNNRLKTGSSSSSLTSDHVTHMKKQLSSLNSRPNLKATEPLKLTLEDVRSADKRGKWWLVGASWKGREQHPSTSEAKPEQNANQPHLAQDNVQLDNHNNTEISDSNADNILSAPQDLTALAASNGMNTPLRRQIFAVLLSSSDYQEAHTNLQKVAVTRKQRLEIVRVLLRCAAREQYYNHYYTLIARRLCGSKRDRLHREFKFCLLQFLKSLNVGRPSGLGYDGEEDEEDEYAGEAGGIMSFVAGDSSGKTGLTARVNLAKLYGALIADGTLSILDLAVIDFVALSARQGARKRAADQTPGVMFLELLLVTVILQASRSKRKPVPGDIDGAVEMQGGNGLEGVFEPALNMPKLLAGLSLFVRRVVRKSDLVTKEKEKDRLRERCKRVANVLARGSGAESMNTDEF